jgi:CheY-like chemotaxis protein
VAQSARSARSAGGEQPQILVVEDDSDLREALCSVLEDAGYSVAGFANGLEALEYLRRGEPPRLVLLDLMMPVMSGWEFREEQMKDPRLSPIPVVILSAHVKADIFGQSLGVASTIRKPLSVDELVRVVARYCERDL